MTDLLLLFTILVTGAQPPAPGDQTDTRAVIIDSGAS